MAQVSLARDLACGFGLGRFPWAPGTLASFVALLAGAALLRVSPWLLAAAAAAAVLAGVWAIGAAGVGDDDPTWVVIDEVAGQWLTLLALARPTAPGLVSAFLLFRVLDIAKPGPIGWVDRRRGPVAVMGDDVAAGLLGAALLLAARWAWPGCLG